MSAAAEFLAKVAAAKRAAKVEGVFAVSGGWKHSRSVSFVFASREDAEMDYRFCRDADLCQLTD